MGIFQKFCLDFNSTFFSDQFSVAVSDEFSCSCGKSIEENPLMSERFVNYLQNDSHNGTNEAEDTRMQSFIRIKNRLIWICEHTSRHRWTWWYEDVRVRVYQQVHMDLRIWGCEDARIQGNTHKLEDMKMYGCKQEHMNLRTWGCKDARTQIIKHERKDIRKR